MIKLLLHESKRRVGSPGVFITPGTYFIGFTVLQHFLSKLTILDKFSLLGNKLSFLIATVDKVKVQRNIQFIC